MSNLIIVPFAFKDGANTGVNIRHKQSSLDIYLKNCCIALISARLNNAIDTDCALVTNIRIPQKYAAILNKNGIKVIKQEFDCFNFGDNYRWSLAFYKLCALYRIVRSTEYESYAYLDSDVIVQSSFDDIWTECAEKILMYNLNEKLGDEEYNHIFNEATPLLKSCDFIHYGGEFFAASKENAIKFSSISLSVYNEMVKKKVATSHGDEFIISLAAQSFVNDIADTGIYVCRIWTGTYRSIPPYYFSSVVLHMPAEKEYGIIRLFNKYISKGKALPDKEKLYSICHINTPSILTLLKIFVKRILKLRVR